MDDTREKVKKESQRFDQALPELLTTLEGRWVVFKDNKIHGDFATEAEAYVDAVKRFGLDGSFVVHQVTEEEPFFLTAGAVYSVQIGF